MAEKKRKWGEKGAELYRNVNAVVALGALAVGVVLPATAIITYPYAAFNGLQAVGGELARRHFAKKKGKR